MLRVGDTQWYQGGEGFMEIPGAALSPPHMYSAMRQLARANNRSRFRRAPVRRPGAAISIVVGGKP